MTDVSDPSTAPALPEHIEKAVDAIADIHRRHHQQSTSVQRWVARFTNVVARGRFVGGLTILLILWIGVNGLAQLAGVHPPDPPPFNYLEILASLASVYITLLILIAQRRENELSDAREQLTLELTLLNEQKSAKIVALLEELRRDMPTVRNRPDAEAESLSAPADPQAMMDALRKTTDDVAAAPPEGEVAALPEKA